MRKELWSHDLNREDVDHARWMRTMGLKEHLCIIFQVKINLDRLGSK